MTGYIANTDYDWYTYLFDKPETEEVNFWRPLGTTQFRALSTGYPFFFKLKKKYRHAIVGFAFFVMYRPLQLAEAWEVFRDGNGTATFDEMQSRVAKYFQRAKGIAPPKRHQIGCILLTSPVFFPPELWVTGPSDWHDNIVAGKTYDTTVGEGKRIWNDCFERTELIQLADSAAHNLSSVREKSRFGTELIIRPRLGQGTFRYAVENIYKKCAVTREHSLPALDAAHIVPYSRGGTHEISNGILLRADIHRLYDRGYVTITPNYDFRVSDKLYDDYQNGKVYYNLNGSKIAVPEELDNRPSKALLERHASDVFLG